MPRIAYTVTATLPDEQSASEYIRWLRTGHIDAVIRGGADQGMICRVIEPAEPIRVQTRYTFATREMYDRYIAIWAPALRQEGLERFGPGSGVTFERTLAEII